MAIICLYCRIIIYPISINSRSHTAPLSLADKETYLAHKARQTGPKHTEIQIRIHLQILLQTESWCGPNAIQANKLLNFARSSQKAFKHGVWGLRLNQRCWQPWWYGDGKKAARPRGTDDTQPRKNETNQEKASETKEEKTPRNRNGKVAKRYTCIRQISRHWGKCELSCLEVFNALYLWQPATTEWRLKIAKDKHIGNT